MAEPPAKTRNVEVSEPSAPKTVSRMPTSGVSLIDKTTAPQPSPKSTQVLLSCQSTMVLSFSELTTSAFL